MDKCFPPKKSQKLEFNNSSNLPKSDIKLSSPLSSKLSEIIETPSSSLKSNIDDDIFPDNGVNGILIFINLTPKEKLTLEHL